MSDNKIVENLLEQIAIALKRCATALERSADADERAANPLEALTVAMATAERMEAESWQRTAGKPAQSVVEPAPIPLTPPPPPAPPDQYALPESEQWRLR